VHSTGPVTQPVVRQPVVTQPMVSPPIPMVKPAEQKVTATPVEPKISKQPVESKPVPQPIASKPALVPPPVVATPVKPIAVPKPTAAAATSKITPPPHKPVATPAAVNEAAGPSPVKTLAAEPERATLAKPSGEFRRRDVNPHHGEKYWQIAAYGQRSLNDYLKVLAARGFQPLVAPGPSESIYRVFIGPFPNNDALEQAHRSIQGMGIEPILRSY